MLRNLADSQRPSGSIFVCDFRFVPVCVLNSNQATVLLQVIARTGGKGLENELVIAFIRNRCCGIAVIKSQNAVLIQLVDVFVAIFFVVMTCAITVCILKIYDSCISVLHREAFQHLGIVQAPATTVAEVAADIIDVIYMRKRNRQHAIRNTAV